MTAKRITARERSKRARYGVILLMLVLVFLFVAPLLFQGAHNFLDNMLLTGMLLFAALSIDRARRKMFITALAVIVIEWLAFYFELRILMSLSQVILFLYFILIVISLITQVATTKRVTARVIIESISGYLLLGIVFSMIIMVIERHHPSAYSFGVVVPTTDGGHTLSEFIYYGFVTFTTLGYGDIVPLEPVSRSVAVLASVSGQIYLTVIIAMLVGKFLSNKQES